MATEKHLTLKQHIRPAILILAVICSVLMFAIPQYSGFFPLALFPVFILTAGKAFLAGQELYTYLQRNFPDYYNRQRLFNGSVPGVWLLSEREILAALDATVLQMVFQGRIYVKTALMVFAIIPLLCVGLIITKW